MDTCVFKHVIAGAVELLINLFVNATDLLKMPLDIEGECGGICSFALGRVINLNFLYRIVGLREFENALEFVTEKDLSGCFTVCSVAGGVVRKEKLRQVIDPVHALLLCDLIPKHFRKATPNRLIYSFDLAL